MSCIRDPHEGTLVAEMRRGTHFLERLVSALSDGGGAWNGWEELGMGALGSTPGWAIGVNRFGLP